MTDALLNYETVKVFGNEEYERNELDQCIMKYQDVEYKLMASLNGLNVLQSIIIFSGLIAGLMVCVKVQSPWAKPSKDSYETAVSIDLLICATLSCTSQSLFIYWGDPHAVCFCRVSQMGG